MLYPKEKIDNNKDYYLFTLTADAEGNILTSYDSC